MKLKKKIKTGLSGILLSMLMFLLAACTSVNSDNVQTDSNEASASAELSSSASEEDTNTEETQTSDAEDRLEIWTGISVEDLEQAETVEDVPEYAGEIYAVLNENEPGFTEEELSVTESYESYSELDELGRCGVCIACIGTDIMPTEERGSIGQVKPTGWHTVKYDCVDGLYLYNRCHLIAYELAAENANEQNLITGTRYLNVEGMLPLENMVTDFIKETGYHVLYRVTPVFEGDNLVASGVQMEARSLEDDGEGICYNLFVYNIQPGIAIDYATGESWESDDVAAASGDASASGTTAKDSADESSGSTAAEGGTDSEDTPAASSSNTEETDNASTDNESETYVVNTNTKKFHRPTCSSVEDIAEYNRQDFTGSRETLISQGFEPCKRCNP